MSKDATKKLNARGTARSHRPTGNKFVKYIGSNWAPDKSKLPAQDKVAPFAKKRRDAVAKAFPGKVLVIPAGGEITRSNDTNFRFRAHSAFAHLTGWGSATVPDSVLVIDARRKTAKSVLYFRETAGKNTDEFFADVMIGEDATYFINRTSTQTAVNGGPTNTSMNSNSLFLEQAYASIRAPIGNGWDFKVGKFVSILGYEVMERPANMNTTFGLIFNQLPLYYTGVLSSYKFDEYIDGKLGVVNGSNSDNNTTTNPNDGDGCALLAALNFTAPGGNANWSNNFQYSTGYDNNTATGSGNSSQGYNNNGGSVSAYTWYYNSWGNWAPKFAEDKLLLAFNTVWFVKSGNTTGPTTVNSSVYGVGAYAKYQFNDWFSLASRGEYLGSNNDLKFGTQGNPSTSVNNGGHVTGTNLWEYTLTAGFNVIDNLLLRAEYRMDWGSNIVSNGNVAGNNSGNVSGGPAYYAGAEVVYSF